MTAASDPTLVTLAFVAGESGGTTSTFCPAPNSTTGLNVVNGSTALGSMLTLSVSDCTPSSSV